MELKSALDKEALKDTGADTQPQASFTDLDNCVDTLVRCRCLDPGEKEVMKEALRGSSPVALSCMTVLAKHADQQAMVSEPLGSPVQSVSQSADPKKMALERYREASRRLN